MCTLTFFWVRIGGGSNPQVAGSRVTGRRSWVVGCRSQIAGYEIKFHARLMGNTKHMFIVQRLFLSYISSLLINSFSVLIVLYYSWKSDGCPFIISLNCDIKADCFQHNIYNRNWLFLTNVMSAEECLEIWEKVSTKGMKLMLILQQSSWVDAGVLYIELRHL